MVDRSEFDFTDASLPSRYDTLLVPRLFHPWAEALVASLAPPPGTRALDVATGPGTVARVLSRTLGPGGVVAGCDSSTPMIEQARSKGDVPGGAPIAYTVAPAAPLPYPDASFDSLTCQQGLQFFPDVFAALAEMVRVLVPRRRAALSVWQPIETCSVFHAYAEALARAGFSELCELLQAPFPRWDAAELADRARSAGFRKADVTTVTLGIEFPGGIDEVAKAITGSPLGPALASLPTEAHGRIRAMAEDTFRPLRKETAVAGPMTAWLLMAKT